MIDKRNQEFTTPEDFQKLFCELVEAESFKDKKVDIRLTPESYLTALNLTQTVVDPVRLIIGDYKIWLYC